MSRQASDAAARRDQLLIAITRCSHVESARADPSHSCADVVGVQEGDAAEFQVPEPWSGHIDRAPILFVGSNPSISEDEDFPTSSWSEAETIGFFQHRFDKDGNGPTRKRFTEVEYWKGVRARAGELLGRDAVEGEDFALTEVVHCKSKEARGVRQALPVCTQRWIDEVLSQSVARVVVLLGVPAREACTRHWKVEGGKSVRFDVPIAGRCRAVVVLPHPSAWVAKTLNGHKRGRASTVAEHPKRRQERR